MNKQPDPIKNEYPSCHDLVMQDLVQINYPEIIRDIEKRKQEGIRIYGTVLQPFNSRSMAQDAYEEILDLAVYAKGCILESKPGWMQIYDKIILLLIEIKMLTN